ncbi:uncharacterized protein LOC105387149 isoform X1 [Plutella xylostella]|uniref:uncharacterized protein LOC105387149 isoform X1 n=1 Tax=Plutella xylostella TaxID=51655 RepID=UPI002032452D|nr:uncharacterized protein LOC105387149 isoform X1 [Plutella xylostella]XP_048488235.1 uncharacterized protein LOC105387149 isoform X1 [Plutella xylostella]
MGVRWIRTKKYQILSVILLISLIYYVISYRSIIMDGTEARSASASGFWFLAKPLSRRHHIEQLFAKRLEDALKEDMGTRCEMPKLDPFDKEIMQFYHKADKIQCPGFDWVRCELSTCKLRPEIIESHYNIVCKYRDIVFVTDKQSTMGAPITVNGNDVYKLVKSDHVEVECTGLRYEDNKPEKWFGYTLGFRSSVSRVRPEPGREDTINVVMLGIDSTSKNGFIRNMPRTYKLLEEEFGAVIMDGYNILGDGTPATLFPLLTGKTELELPDRRRAVSKAFIDDFPFVFRRLQKDGYRTLYFEDSPTIGTFQYRFNGFEIQPADHYLRHFYLHANKHNKKHHYCIGDTPSYMLMMNKTEEFLRLDGKKFAFSFIADVTHDRIMLSAIDDDVSEWLMRFRNEGHGENTLLVVHADHGPRFAKERSTYIGKLEERLPFLAIMLPESYKRAHPKALDILKANKKMLTTPHDLYETYVEMLGLYGWKNLHKVPGSELPRGLSMLEPIPPTRTCAEAGIEAHWCACVKWVNVTPSDVLYGRSAQALVDYINAYTEVARSQCVLRMLTSIDYVLRQAPNKRLLTFKLTKDSDGYVPDFNGHTETDKVTFTVKIAVAPGFGVYEATMTYLVKEDKFQLDYHSISRSNGYNNEPSCISATHPHLNMYCYCKQYLNTNT